MRLTNAGKEGWQVAEFVVVKSEPAKKDVKPVPDAGKEKAAAPD